MAGYTYWVYGDGSHINDFSYILPISGMELGIRYFTGKINKKIILFTEANIQLSAKGNIKDFNYRRYESIIVRGPFNNYSSDTLVLNGIAKVPVEYTKAKFIELTLGYGINYYFSSKIYLSTTVYLGLGIRKYENKFKGFDIISTNDLGPLLMFKSSIGYRLF